MGNECYFILGIIFLLIGLFSIKSCIRDIDDWLKNRKGNGSTITEFGKIRIIRGILGEVTILILGIYLIIKNYPF